MVPAIPWHLVGLLVSGDGIVHSTVNKQSKILCRRNDLGIGGYKKLTLPRAALTAGPLLGRRECEGAIPSGIVS